MGVAAAILNFLPFCTKLALKKKKPPPPPYKHAHLAYINKKESSKSAQPLLTRVLFHQRGIMQMTCFASEIKKKRKEEKLKMADGVDIGWSTSVQ